MNSRYHQYCSIPCAIRVQCVSTVYMFCSTRSASKGLARCKQQPSWEWVTTRCTVVKQTTQLSHLTKGNPALTTKDPFKGSSGAPLYSKHMTGICPEDCTLTSEHLLYCDTSSMLHQPYTSASLKPSGSSDEAAAALRETHPAGKHATKDRLASSKMSFCPTSHRRSCGTLRSPTKSGVQAASTVATLPAQPRASLS